MVDIGEGVIALINQMYTQMIPYTEQIAAVIVKKVNVVAAIGAILYIFGNLIKQIYYNEEINFLPYLRPFLILMLIPMLPLITDGIDSIATEIRTSVNGSNSKISERIHDNSKYMQDAIDRKWDRIGNDEALYKETFGSSRSNDDSGVFPIGDDIKLFMGKSTDEIKIALVLLIQNLLITLMYIAEAALLLMSLCYKLILKMGFPIVVTLTIFPGFTNNLISWFGRYVNFSLLPAVAAMYSTIAFGLMDLYLQTDPIDVASGSDTQNPEFLGFAYIGVLILCLIGYIFVPSMTSMLVTIGGVGNITGGTTRALAQASGTANRVGTNAANKISRISSNAIGGAATGAATGAALGRSFADTNSSKAKTAASTVVGSMGGAMVGAIKGVSKPKNNNKA
ncbi:hypothetical protein CLV98_12327 [Dyadobacter jejuensis]|uniref:Conjugative transposon TraJ C-terminal domain-containing protein n=1 Tax=Dyadobacter jejuensis TaxID=1082580 RepID=A0A316A744_9BACT|nr:hypothetical protein [Dyadobacter jejuensis]PWJ53413.1 hypothetical protein CLV98_12327 [Dyadobacter jejuensis]